MKHSRKVRRSVTADTLNGLHRKQDALNARAGAFFRYENEQQYTAPNGKTRWVSFYFMDLDLGAQFALDDKLNPMRGDE